MSDTLPAFSQLWYQFFDEYPDLDDARNVYFAAFGKVVREQRTQLHFTLARLAKKAKMATTTLQRIEKGARRLYLEDINKLAAVFGTDTESLMSSAFQRCMTEVEGRKASKRGQKANHRRITSKRR